MPQDSHRITITIDCGPHDPAHLVGVLSHAIDKWAEGEHPELVCEREAVARRAEVYALITTSSTATFTAADTRGF